ncbi:TfuA-like protein [Streptomyces crystallinus]|uniref:TfuA-like core domain-containing protein n=1 Tax=Streptomyces crystallinus TaxID=68191 RepID=A0ABN1GH17_9ACTN
MIHVYTGPTLGSGEPVLCTPQVSVHPPVRHGDLFDAGIADGDTVVLIDGAYHQVPALRHKEILAALARGIRVYGAASIGALRAVELAPYGMTGIGRVYRAYASGEIEGDDEVAVGQDPDGEYVRLTWPLVNLREVLRHAVAERILDRHQAAELVQEWAGVYYAQRTTGAVRSVCLRVGAGALERWLMARLAADEHFGDVKRADAIEAVTRACAAAPRQQVATSTGCWDTVYYRRWAHFFTASHTGEGVVPVGLRLSYQRLFDPAFPTVWLAWLEHLSRHPGPEAADEAMPLASRVQQMAPAAASLPAHLIFRPEPDLSDPATRALLLMRESPADRAAIVRYLEANHAARTDAGHCCEAISTAAAHHTLLHLWNISPNALGGHAAACGYRTAQQALEELKVFMTGLLLDQNRLHEAVAR